jgi:mono/diheme cytochrome c family protein
MLVLGVALQLGKRFALRTLVSSRFGEGLWIALAATAALSLGCGSSSGDGDGGGGGVPTTTHVDGAPLSGHEPARTAVKTPATPTSLAVLDGGIAFGSKEGLYAAKIGDTAFAIIPAVDDDGNFVDAGAIVRLARRDGGGILVDAEKGLFDDDDGVLLASPLGAAIDHASIDAMSAIGTGSDEELWVLAKGKVIRVAHGKLDDVSVQGQGAVETAFVAASGRGVVVSDDAGWLIDVSASDATDFASHLAHPSSGDRGDDGSVSLATDAGLVTRDRAGNVVFYSFAPNGKPAEKVVAVSSAFGTSFAATERAIVAITEKGPELVATPTKPVTALATDAVGDLWSIEGGVLYHHATGAPVSFAKNVEPFIKAHCATCHENGQNGAPKLDFESYDVAKKYAPIIGQRLNAPTSDGVMPPASAGTLTASDYAVVTRWIASGLLP